IRITNEWTKGRMAACVAFIVFCYFLYSWKSGGWLGNLFYQHHWFPYSLSSPNVSIADPAALTSILKVSASSPSFWYTVAYSIIVVIFGIRRIRRRKTAYVRLQTLTLMSIQIFPLFLLPEIILPWLGYHHLIPLKAADALFPAVNYGHG